MSRSPDLNPPRHLAAEPAAAPDTASPAVAPGWWRAVGRRVRHRLLLKTLGISGFTWLFFVAYFHLLRHPAYPVTEMPLTALDHWIPAQPGALAAYLTLWFYVGVPPGLMTNLRHVVLYGLWAAALCLTGLAIFYFWPTAVPPRGAELAGEAGFALIQGVDAAGNACPSLHVATAVFTGLWVHHTLRLTQAPRAMYWVNAAWVLLIVHSTLAIRQHVVLDVLAGTALALAFAWPSLRWHPVGWPALRGAVAAGPGR